MSILFQDAWCFGVMLATSLICGFKEL